jgi:hypothetical protein
MKFKNLFSLIVLVFISISITNAQSASNDTIVKMSGERIAVKVLSTSENSVTFSWPGETMTISMSKNLIEEIKYASGRKEKLSEKIVIRGEDDWEKVKQTTQASDIEGLVKKGDITGTTANLGLYTPLKKCEAKILVQLKHDAAKLGAHIILITNPLTEQKTRYTIGGVAYGYK